MRCWGLRESKIVPPRYDLMRYHLLMQTTDSPDVLALIRAPLPLLPDLQFQAGGQPLQARLPNLRLLFELRGLLLAA